MKCGCNEKDLENFLENPNSVNLRCSSTWELICTGNVKGCFQIDGNLGRHYCKKIKPVSIEELSDLIALIRPGCLEAFLDGKNMTDHYVDRKAGTEEVPHYHPIYDEIMKNTYGILIYQEQAIQIAEQIAGFDKKEADILRKAIGKKLPEEIAKAEKLFLEKGLPFGVASEEQLKEIFSWIKASQRYSFNACITPDTLVELEGGSRISIDELKIGSMINSPFGFVKVLNKYENGIREVFCVELESGLKINATLDHKFLCKYNEPYNMYSCGKQYSLRDILKHDLEIYTQHGLEKIDQITRMVPSRVVDIEVDHHEHIFYGNGIATSNSHSCAYAYNAYISAYLKTHFPYRFFLSYLQHANDKPDAHEEISELITDARKFSITVQGPRLEHLKEVFYKDNENIRFGLQNIKSVGNSAFSKLPQEIPASWTTFLFFLAPNVNSKAVESLIGAGALSSYGVPRIRMLYELDKFLSLTDKEQDAIREVNPPSLLDGLDYLIKNKKYHNVRRLQYLQEIYKLLLAPPTKLEDNPDWLVQQENTLLGYPISASRMENFQTSRSNCTCKEFPTSDLSHYSIVAEVKNRKEIVCKRGKSAGQKMAFLTIDDGTDAMEAVVFPKSYEEFSYLLSPGRIVLLKGTKDKERSSLIINKVFD